MNLDVIYLRNNMIISKDIIINEEVVYPKETIVNSDVINKLKAHGITSVDVYTGEKYCTFGTTFNRFVDELIKSNQLDKIEYLANLYKQISENTDYLFFDSRKYITSEFNASNHNINIINMAIILGDSFNKINSKNDQIPIDKLALCAILQNIGRTALDENVLNRLKNKYDVEINKLIEEYPNIPTNILDEYNSKFHPVYSYLLVKDFSLSEDVAKVTLLHHESENAETTLIGQNLIDIEDKTIQNICRILKIVDLYDVLIFKGKENNPDYPFREIGINLNKLVSSGFINAKLTNLLKIALPLYREGMKVLLSDETTGIISLVDNLDITKPKVKDLNGNSIDLDYENIEIRYPIYE